LNTPVTLVSNSRRHFLVRHVAHGAEQADAGVVDERIEAAEARHGRAERSGHVGGHSDVGAQREDAAGCLAFEIGRCGAQAVVRRAGDRHRGAARRERPGGSEPDAARAAGYQDHHPHTPAPRSAGNLNTALARRSRL
jgi:hypothetical protein